MRITKIETMITDRPEKPRQIRDALQVLTGSGVLTVAITNSEGHTGYGDLHWGRIINGPDILQRIIEDEFSPLLVGEDPFLIKGIREKLWAETDYYGTSGLGLWAIAGIDIALWDLMGHTMGQPVYRLLGAHKNKVPVYAMVGWLNWTVDELKAICTKAVEQGFRAVKMKVGAPTLEEDVQRIRAVQEAVGKEITVMVDANQVFSVSEAIIRGKVYEEMGCFWFEEPLRADDKEGLAELRSRLNIRIASGENNFGKRDFREMLEKRCVDILQADIRRAGGVTEIMEIAAMADAFNIPYASHGGGVQLHMLAAMPNALYMETGLVGPNNKLTIENGYALVPDLPGFGQIRDKGLGANSNLKESR